MKRVAFYAPVKPPDHPIPSGDREISRLLIKAMQHAGHDVEVASKYIAYQKRPGSELFETRRAGGEAEARELISNYLAMPASKRPKVWFTYHTYCKAPDYLGPAVSDALGIPYITAEACRTRQNEDADWQDGRTIVQNSMKIAKRNFCLKPSDREYLDEVLGASNSIIDLPPFVDEKTILDDVTQRFDLPFANNDPVVLTVGMMRPGKKHECHLMLAEALDSVSHDRWNLVVVGDGPAREDIENRLGFISPDRLYMTGLLTPPDVHRAMASSDIFAWPGYREPIGMVYLEAQCLGLPVAAMNSLGVPTVVGNGESGLLSPEADIRAYGKAIQRLIDNRDLRHRLGDGGRKRVNQHHGIAAAARLLSQEIEAL